MQLNGKVSQRLEFHWVWVRWFMRAINRMSSAIDMPHTPTLCPHLSENGPFPSSAWASPSHAMLSNVTLGSADTLIFSLRYSYIFIEDDFQIVHCGPIHGQILAQIGAKELGYTKARWYTYTTKGSRRHLNNQRRSYLLRLLLQHTHTHTHMK